MSIIKDKNNLETQLREALEDRKIVVGQLKSVEKLLEDVLTEKDQLADSNSELTIETSKVRISSQA